MGKILVLAEKPSVGREIARVMGAGGKQNGYFEGSQYVVTWALGHLVTLADPEHYGEQYKKWDLSTLPMLPDKMELVVIKETSKQYKVVKDLLKRKDIDELVIATDAGREGELVARWIIEKAGFHKPIKRLWISSQTDKAIKEGFAHLHPAKEYERLYQAAVCRAEADWVVGLNVTRALTCKYNAQLSAGRVQTPTLAMIVQREKEIKKFVPKEYYTITAETAGFQLLWRDGQGQTRLFDGERADRLVREISGKAATVTEVKKDLKREAPPLLYDLTELQRDANKRFGFSAKQTLNIMQKLYEEHKLLTYPRTDSRYLSADIVPTLPERLKAISIGDYRPFAAAILKNGVKTNKRIVSLALRNKDAILIGLGGPECGDIVITSAEGYNYDHADSLSTTYGYAHTSVSPIFLAAGPGIKKNHLTERVIRQVDLTPTMALLAGVRMPAQCEGAPIYQILEDDLRA